MLVNLTPDLVEIARREGISKEHNFEYIPQSHPQWLQETGIYQSSVPYNFPYMEFEEFKDVMHIPEEQSYQIFAPTYHKIQFGVADNIEQIKEYYKEEIEDPDKKYFIDCTAVFQDRDNKGKGGGWRWHKWGTYIGVLDSQYEYLDDEEFGDDFKYVICFQIVLVI